MNFHSAKKEWNFTLFLELNFQSFHRVLHQYNPFEWFSFMFIKFKHTSVERDYTEGTLCKKNEYFTLKRLKFHSLQSENSLLTVWNYTRMEENKLLSFLVDWNVNFFDWPEELLRIDFLTFDTTINQSWFQTANLKLHCNIESSWKSVSVVLIFLDCVTLVHVFIIYVTSLSVVCNFATHFFFQGLNNLHWCSHHIGGLLSTEDSTWAKSNLPCIRTCGCTNYEH